MLRTIIPLVFLLAVTMESFAQDRSYGRSVVMTKGGIVATSHYLASQAGAQILAKGGTAMDAAIAANAVLGVTDPMSNGMGGATRTFRGVSGEAGHHIHAWRRDS